MVSPAGWECHTHSLRVPDAGSIAAAVAAPRLYAEELFRDRVVLEPALEAEELRAALVEVAHHRDDVVRGVDVVVVHEDADVAARAVREDLALLAERHFAVRGVDVIAAARLQDVARAAGARVVDDEVAAGPVYYDNLEETFGEKNKKRRRKQVWHRQLSTRSAWNLRRDGVVGQRIDTENGGGSRPHRASSTLHGQDSLQL